MKFRPLPRQQRRHSDAGYYVIACCDELTEAAIPTLVNRWFPFIFGIDDDYAVVLAANKLWPQGRTVRVI